MPDTLTPAEAEQAADAMTADRYGYARGLLVSFFLTLSREDARRVLNHVGRYCEKVGGWPAIPWEPDNA
jgi:hypothetical protein